MTQIKYDELSDDVQHMIASLQIEVAALQFESSIYRAAAFVTFLILTERIWERLF